MRFPQVDQILKPVDRILRVVCSVCVAIIAGITTLDGLGRYLFNRPIAPAYEITEQYLIVAVVFLAMGFVYKEGGHVDVALLYDKLPQSVQKFLDRLNAILIFILFLLIAVASWRVGVRMIRVGGVMSSIDIPTGPAHFLVVIGSIFLMIRLMEALFLKRSDHSKDEGQ